MTDPALSTPNPALPARMRLSFLLSVLAAVLLSGAVLAASLTFWVVLRTTALEERAAVAHDSYAAHQALQSSVFRLFKENADALLIGDRDRSARETALKNDISATLDEITQA